MSEDLKCNGCGEWFPLSEMDKHWLCKCSPEFRSKEIKLPFTITKCEHEWVEVFTSFGYLDGCRKCKAVK